MPREIYQGNEAIAQAALDAGIKGAFSYPGTPSTEIFEYLYRKAADNPELEAHWCTNEKVAYEAGLGMSLTGRRVMVSMKQVGLNVAGDPFMCSVITGVGGGLVLVVADDPGQHASQTEQDTRIYAAFAHVPVVEPSNPQEAYDLTRQAFELSEQLNSPILLRVVTRLAHARTSVETVDEPRPIDPLNIPDNLSKTSFNILPANSRRRWLEITKNLPEVAKVMSALPTTWLTLGKQGGLGILTHGIAYDYVMEALGDLPPAEQDVSCLKVTGYPVSRELVQQLVDHVGEILVVEEGTPYLEDKLRGLLDVTPVLVRGKRSGHLPLTGELNPDQIRVALGHAPRETLTTLKLPFRPPTLCPGCPHTASFKAIRAAMTPLDSGRDEGGDGKGEKHEKPTFGPSGLEREGIIFGDIGCYTLGALDPHNAMDTCVNMGASISMAMGAVYSGVRPVVAVIGDSTFAHSGMTGLLDAIQADLDMTVIILDNSTVAMTGDQPSATTGVTLDRIVLGLGVDPDHFGYMIPRSNHHEENTELLRREIEHRGTSVIIADRPCVISKQNHARRPHRTTQESGTEI